ncbi:cytidine deaminase-like fold-containing protein [Marinomonas sp. TW1]|uniref:cytidine deaminase-like fold-containing protein n=1 Tax=Marinomonas sp. TW1 TaxID=1561203 RepID=UPI0007AEEEF9|nr:hypothetical protein [Marinomonas sp. TW1]
MLSKTGWEDIANDISATHDAVASGVDYVADEIAVLGNDLPEELRGRLGETGEDVVDAWIRADFSDEEIAEALEREGIQDSLANLESIKGKSQEDFLAEVNQQEQNQATETSAQKVISDEDGSHFLDPVEISSNGPTALAVGTDALGKLNQEAQALAEENPVLSSMLSYGIDAVGGPVKAAVGILVDEGLSAVAGDELAQVGEAVTSYVGAKIQNVDVDEYRELRTDEQNDTALYNSLESGESMINTDDGVGAIATIIGVDLGRKGVNLGDKKASSDGGDDADSSGSIGSGSGSEGSTPPKVTAEAEVDGVKFNDTNQGSRPPELADPNKPTLIADDIQIKIDKNPDKPFPNGNMATAHAEVGAIQQAFDAGTTQGKNMTMTVEGMEVCGYCRSDLRKAADKAGLNSLTIYEAKSGKTLTWTRREDGSMGKLKETKPEGDQK